MNFHLPHLARLALAAVLASASALGSVGVAAADAMETVALAHFTTLRVDGPAEITLVQGEQEMLTLENAGSGRTPVRIEEDHGRLVLRNGGTSGWDFLVGRKVTPRITLAFRDLREIDLNAAARVRMNAFRGPSLIVRASGDANLNLVGIDANDLTLECSGAVRAQVAGRVHRQKLVVSGAGVYNAAELRSDDARVLVSGAARVSVNARDTLEVNVSGAGKVEYLGDPKVTRHVSGAASIERREARSGKDG